MALKQYTIESMAYLTTGMLDSGEEDASVEAAMCKVCYKPRFNRTTVSLETNPFIHHVRIVEDSQRQESYYLTVATLSSDDY